METITIILVSVWFWAVMNLLFANYILGEREVSKATFNLFLLTSFLWIYYLINKLLNK